METINWEDVEIELAIWCHHAMENGQIDVCKCPYQKRLEAAEVEALNRLYTALKTGTYHGDWKSILTSQSED